MQSITATKEFSTSLCHKNIESQRFVGPEIIMPSKQILAEKLIIFHCFEIGYACSVMMSVTPSLLNMFTPCKLDTGY